MIEFAFIAPIFFLFLIGLLELGLVRFGNSLIDNMITQFARASMVGCQDNEFTGGTCDAPYLVDIARLRNMITKQSGGFVRGTDCSRFSLSVRPLASVNMGNLTTGSEINLGQGGEIMVFYASYDWPVLFPWMQRFFGNEIVYETVTVVRNEPFGDLGAAREGDASAGCG